MYKLLSPLLRLGIICSIGGCGTGMDSESESQTAGLTTLGSATNSTTQSSASTSLTATSADSSAATESDSDATSGGSGTTGSSDSATSEDSATEGTGTTTGGATATTGDDTTTGGDDTTTTGDDTTTTGDSTTEGTTTGGDTTGGDLPDFVAECDDDPENPVIVTIKPNVTARYPSIFAAVQATIDGAVIEVCPGTYDDKIEVFVDTTLRGAGPDLTIIDGGGFHFDLGNGEATVEGFGFTNSNAKVPSGWNIASSGAISVEDNYNAQETLTVRDCRFYGNSAEHGAGLHIDGSNNGGKNPDIYVENSVFENNAATVEGGAIASYGRVHIVDSIFVENEARTGGALALSYGCTSVNDCDITNTVLKKNQATGTGKYEGGGALFLDSCGYQCLGGLKVTNSDFGFGADEENTDHDDLPEDVLINDGSDPWTRYGWYANDVSFTCSNGSCTMP